MWKKHQILILILIIAIAAFFRLYKIAEVPQGLYPDEAMNGNNALEAIHNSDFKVFYEDNNGREGLFINIQAIFLWLFQKNEPWVLRLPSALFGILTVLGLYFLTKELFDKNSQTKNVEENSSPSFADSGLVRNPDCHLNYSITKQKKLSSISVDNLKAEPAKGFAPLESQVTIRDPHFAAGSATTNITNIRAIDKNKEIVALLSSFFLAVSFWHINFSRIGFRAIMAPFFLVWGLYFLLKSLRNTNQYEFTNSNCKNSYFVNAIIGSVLYGLGFYSYIAYRVTPFIIFIIFLFYWLANKELIVRKTILLVVGCWLLVVFAIALPLCLYFLNNPADFMGRSGQVSIFASASPLKTLFKNIVLTLGMFNIRGDCNWRHNIACSPQLDFIVGILFLIGLGYSIWQILKKHNYREENIKMIFGFWILAFGFLLMLSPAILSAEGLPHALRAILTIPFVYIFIGLGAYISVRAIINMLKKMDGAEINKLLGLAPRFKMQPASENEKRRFGIIIIAAIAFLFMSQTYYFYFIDWAGNKNVFAEFSGRYVEIGKYLNALPDQIPKYVVINIERIPFEERYSGRKLPMAAATTMFITNSFLPDARAKKNIRYLLPGELEKIEIEKNAVVVYLEPNS